MRIDSYSFGRIRIDSTDYANDVLVLRDRVVSPWWRQAGGHVYAIRDLEPLIALAPEVVCLGTGYFGRVTVQEPVFEAFSGAETRVLVGRTGRMVEEYNGLVEEGCDVAAALHLTC